MISIGSEFALGAFVACVEEEGSRKEDLGIHAHVLQSAIFALVLWSQCVERDDIDGRYCPLPETR